MDPPRRELIVWLTQADVAMGSISDEKTTQGLSRDHLRAANNLGDKRFLTSAAIRGLANPSPHAPTSLMRKSSQAPNPFIPERAERSADHTLPMILPRYGKRHPV